MKIQLVSDLHIECRREQQRFKWVNPEADIIVIAGDACDYGSVDRLADMLAKPEIEGKQVIYVPGNHEHYRSPGPNQALEQLQRALGGANYGRVRVAYMDSFLSPLEPLEGPPVRFICATLWSDISDPISRLVANGINDFRVPGLTLDWYLDQHRKHVAFIEEEIEKAADAGERTIVVTHHAPSANSVADRFRGSALNACFYTDLAPLMYGEGKPLLWLHGHMHDSCDYTIHKTRVLCNPYGYPNERYGVEKGFDKGLLLEV